MPRQQLDTAVPPEEILRASYQPTVIRVPEQPRMTDAELHTMLTDLAVESPQLQAELYYSVDHVAKVNDPLFRGVIERFLERKRTKNPTH